jgi:BTB/POZ domain
VDDFSFTSFHNLLYFLYTDLANLRFGKYVPVPSNTPRGYPDEADPFELYRLADMYMLPDLAEHCFHYLVHTNTPENICGRLFDLHCEPYQDPKDEYIKFLVSNHSKVIDFPELTDRGSGVRLSRDDNCFHRKVQINHND